jgi:hypothetical protein
MSQLPPVASDPEVFQQGGSAVMDHEDFTRVLPLAGTQLAKHSNRCGVIDPAAAIGAIPATRTVTLCPSHESLPDPEMSVVRVR